MHVSKFFHTLIDLKKVFTKFHHLKIYENQLYISASKDSSRSFGISRLYPGYVFLGNVLRAYENTEHVESKTSPGTKLDCTLIFRKT